MQTTAIGVFPSFPPLLGSILARTHADGVYLYRFDSDRPAARLLAWSGCAPAAEDCILSAAVAQEHARRESPVILYREAWCDPRFAEFPEFVKNRFEGLASVPLIHDGLTLGLLNICRRAPVSASPGELAFLLTLSLPVGALLAGAAENQNLREEIERLNRQLADRKLLERAKGILQARFHWTEEEAYLHLRKYSRQHRSPLREVALAVIGNREFRPVEVQRRAS